MKKFNLLLIVASIFLISSCNKKQQETQESFTFVFMTDIHLQPEGDAVTHFSNAIDEINTLKPDFVITGGDLIMDALEVSYEKADSLYDLYQNITGSFNMPVYNTMGNHEVFGLYEASGISPDHELYGKKMFKERLGHGKTYYSFDHKNWHFIVLDAIGFTPERRYYGNIDSVQLAWLKEDLSKTDTLKPVVISLHIPLISVIEQIEQGSRTPLPEYASVGNSKDVLDLCKNHNLKLVLQGHLHIVEEIIFRDTHFITAGAVCGAWWKGPNKGFPEGYAVIEVKNTDFSWHYQSYIDRMNL